jgi:hypothetical protein
MGLFVPVAVLPPPQSTVYPVTVDPPFNTGAVNATVADPFPAVAASMVGASEGVA